MASYRKKPVIIEAFQMTRARRWDNSDWPDWLNQAWNKGPGEGALFIDSDDPKQERLIIGTLKGVYRVSWDDWIIRGVKGDICGCKPDIFAATYELIEKEESIMEEPNIAREQCPPVAQREKWWDELTDAEKVERMHGVVRHLQEQIGRFQDELDRVCHHEHGHAGGLLVPLNTYGGHFNVAAGDKGKWF